MSKNLSGKYYQENKERLQTKTRARYQNLSKEAKEERQQYGCECCKNLPENKKNLVEYRKKYYRMRKKDFIIIIRNSCFFIRKSIKNI